MKILFCAALSLFAAAITSLAAEAPNPFDGTDTLRYFLSKSTLVVVATVESVIGDGGSRPIYAPGVVQLVPSGQLTGIIVERVLYGTAPEKKTFTIQLNQLGTDNGISGNNVTPKRRYILFLKPGDPRIRSFVGEERIVWQTADVWFGVFPFDTALEMELLKLVKSKAETKSTPEVVEFESFVNPSPDEITGEGIVITDSKIETPVFRVRGSGTAGVQEPHQGEQGADGKTPKAAPQPPH